MLIRPMKEDEETLSEMFRKCFMIYFCTRNYIYSIFSDAIELKN